MRKFGSIYTFSKIDSELVIDEPSLFLPWKIIYGGILRVISGLPKTGENYYSFKLELHDISFVKCLGLQFDNNKLSVVSLFCEHKFRDEKLSSSFIERQKFLKKNFEKPMRQNRTSNALDKQNPLIGVSKLNTTLDKPLPKYTDIGQYVEFIAQPLDCFF